MKTTLLSILAVTLLGVLIVLVAGVVYSQMSEEAIVPELKKDHMTLPAAPPQVKGAGYLGNVIKLSQPADEQQRNVAHLLQEAPAPPSRAAHFQSILNDPQFRLAGWRLEILGVERSEGTTMATVRAIPLITGRQSVTVIGAIDETYEVHGQALKLLKTQPLLPGVSVLFD